MKITKQLHWEREEAPFEYCVGNVPLICAEVVRFYTKSTPHLVEFTVSDEPFDGGRLVYLSWNQYDPEDVCTIVTYKLCGHHGSCMGTELAKMFAKNFYQLEMIYVEIKAI
jgi:hypothetical protein